MAASDFVAINYSSTEERRIATGLIVSTTFCKTVIPKIDSEYFVNPYLKRVAGWAVNYFRKYEEAPFKHIQDIFEQERHRITSEAEINLIEILLTSLSNQYDGAGDVTVNNEYLIQSAEKYFRTRELEIHVNNINALKDAGDLEAAELEIQRFNTVSLELDESLYVNFGDPETRKKLYVKYREQTENFFKFPGDLGDFLGSIKPGDVIGITAPKKRGKSFLLNDFLKHCIISKIPTIKWAIEMTDVEELYRFDKLFIPTIEKESGMYKIPAFDCTKNQTGDCGERESSVIVKPDPKKDVEPHPDHIVCTKCRDSITEHSRFVPTVYHVDIYREQFNEHYVAAEMEKYNELISKYSRVVVRQKYSLTYDLMMQDLDRMYALYGFIPRALLLDYVDILQIASKYDDFKLEDERWKLMQRLASATHALVVTPTQSNKEGEQASTMKSTDQGGFYGKGRHVNLMVGINQTGWEKRNGLYRVTLMDARSTRSNEQDYCMVLQDLKSGQMHLDSYWPGRHWNY